uniref:DUF1176 domain-containing protein n=1 Tax=Thaumasiovibrio occultus TaxID=1891184 RepID=UPI00131BCB4F|nr:DUF1176 domain-containing protein [Thaumasiovibrio occultus]
MLKMIKSAGLCLIAFTPFASALEGVAFSHGDWELACDNTGTCRAVGYHKGYEGNTLSVLFEREAGVNSPVQGYVLFGVQQEPVGPTTLSINGRDYPTMAQIDAATGAYPLTPVQVYALLDALTGTSVIEWRDGQSVWTLSDAGSTAVLLKMDEFQQRVGTPTALVKAGANSTTGILAPQPLPVVEIPLYPPTSEADRQILAQPDLIEALYASADYCDLLLNETPELELWRVSETKVAISAQCWMAAYNWGAGVWLRDDKSGEIEFVTDAATDMADGMIFSVQKGRGIGDCFGAKEWAWDGEQFVPTAVFTTGQCRSVVWGGAWRLPTLTSQTIPPSNN